MQNFLSPIRDSPYLNRTFPTFLNAFYRGRPFPANPPEAMASAWLLPGASWRSIRVKFGQNAEMGSLFLPFHFL